MKFQSRGDFANPRSADLICLMIAAVVLMSAATGSADLIQCRLTGTVIDRFEVSGSFGGVDVGDQFLAESAFDAGDADLIPDDPE